MRKLRQWPANILNDMRLNNHIANPINYIKPDEKVVKNLEMYIDVYLSKASPDDAFMINAYYRHNMTYEEIFYDFHNRGIDKYDETTIEIHIRCVVKEILTTPPVIKFITGQPYEEYLNTCSNPTPHDKSYPMGVLKEARLLEVGAGFAELTEDQLDGLIYAIEMLPAEDRELINLRFKHEMSFRDIAKEIGCGATKARGLVRKTCWKLGREPYKSIIIEGYNAAVNDEDGLMDEFRIKSIPTPVEQLGLSNKAMDLFRMYYRADKDIRKVIKIVQKPLWWQQCYPRIGEKTALDVMLALEEHNYIDRTCLGWRGLNKWGGSPRSKEVISRIGTEILGRYDDLTSQELYDVVKYLNGILEDTRLKEDKQFNGQAETDGD